MFDCPAYSTPTGISTNPIWVVSWTIVQISSSWLSHAATLPSNTTDDSIKLYMAVSEPSQRQHHPELKVKKWTSGIFSEDEDVHN